MMQSVSYNNSTIYEIVLIFGFTRRNSASCIISIYKRTGTTKSPLIRTTNLQELNMTLVWNGNIMRDRTGNTTTTVATRHSCGSPGWGAKGRLSSTNISLRFIPQTTRGGRCLQNWLYTAQPRLLYPGGAPRRITLSAHFLATLITTVLCSK